jgi:hypothetical protein
VIVLAFLVAVVVVAVARRVRLRRHAESAMPAPTWQRTDEVFRDPSSGRLVRVWLDPADGSRHEVPEP